MTRFDLGRRRTLYRLSAAFGLAALGPGLAGSGCSRGETANDANRSSTAADAPGDVALRLRAHPDTVPIRSGPGTEVWRYSADLINGPADSLEAVNASYLGPVIRLRRGQRFRAELVNQLPEETTVHWHGLHVPPEADGQPRLPIRPGESMEVAFDVVDRAGLYWYHAHPHGPEGGRVGYQSNAGLAGPLLIEDEAERALGLPDGEHELLMVVQDRRLSADNELRYIGDGMSARMARMRGFRGDEVLLNGRADTRRSVANRAYRLRVLNGSNARIYKLAWSDGRPITILGTDGGLLAEPEQRRFATLAPAERLDVWVDFSGDAVDDRIDLVSEAFDASAKRGMMRGGMMGSRMSMGGDRLRVASFTIDRSASSSPKLPHRLVEDLDAPTITDDTPVRRFDLGMRMMRGFTINGRQMAGPKVADDEIVRLGDTELWDFNNETPMPHPMHVRGLQFRVVQRWNAAQDDDLFDGLVDTGLHDTVLVLPGECVRIAITFEDFTGLYMYHCHNMEHEDDGMMRYYRVDA